MKTFSVSRFRLLSWSDSQLQAATPGRIQLVSSIRLGSARWKTMLLSAMSPRSSLARMKRHGRAQGRGLVGKARPKPMAESSRGNATL